MVTATDPCLSTRVLSQTCVLFVPDCGCHLRRTRNCVPDCHSRGKRNCVPDCHSRGKRNCVPDCHSRGKQNKSCFGVL